MITQCSLAIANAPHQHLEESLGLAAELNKATDPSSSSQNANAGPPRPSSPAHLGLHALAKEVDFLRCENDHLNLAHKDMQKRLHAAERSKQNLQRQLDDLLRSV